ncbi:histidine phosphatase family protein [Nitratireductor sp. ZSWI3]|uniref:SixA phosphatase family protein n=1 Tax=Nitratireductor sp. ZSWI3 TaxID=2966359 RepID=UPI0021503AF3|nr:histidine phosphatase family protein [Nitratireductor sp. ZSWI3]MCR4268913.1 histidine phosphatase family protein [Nitratireductor sp. ZSWI3]
MYRLFLLRHAKAGWAAPGMTDFDRGLTASGIADARILGRRMRETGLVPDQVLCSPARRARETCDHVLSSFSQPGPEPFFVDELYNSDATHYVDAIRAAAPARSLLIVGHNPMMEDLAYALPAGGDDRAMRLAAAGFPTCGLAVIRFERALSDLMPGSGHLDDFLRPERVRQ